MNTLTRIKQRALHGLAQLLHDRGYTAPCSDPVRTYSDLRVSIMDAIDKHPGMRCYEIERMIGLDTPKQRVTNSILRDLEDDKLIFALEKRWCPIEERIKPTPRQYYLDF